eukprot:TRINITY_DN12832_c0_g1_i1.p1 TRINITY_DN12832_c0_g1~~TRINITY_DN12832_c0_g1_i1.p1  ORF type:complete len:262 (+),score=1.04 TRINITY_DN12832_c0_g1_i1:76-786(+)
MGRTRRKRRLVRRLLDAGTVKNFPPVLDVRAAGEYAEYSGRYTYSNEYTLPFYRQQGSARVLQATSQSREDYRQFFSWGFAPEREGLNVVVSKSMENSATTPLTVAHWITPPRYWPRFVPGTPVQMTVVAALLYAGGEPLGDPQQPLHEAGLSAEGAVELLACPPAAYIPAEEGPLTIFVHAPTLGATAPLCLEVAPGCSGGRRLRRGAGTGRPEHASRDTLGFCKWPRGGREAAA